MGQTAHLARLRGARSVGITTVLGLIAASPLLTGCGTSLAGATTTLAGVIDAQVVHTDGSVVRGVDGLRLHRGDLVRTGPAGRAELHTRGRVVYEGSAASVQVVDGAHDDLRRGALVINALRGPGLGLTIGGLRVSTGADAATRAERSVTVRVAALQGLTTVDNDNGRHLLVPGLSQVIVGGDALPNSTADSPLRLVDDDAEAHTVPSLVRDDLALDALAAGVDTTGRQTLHVVTAAWHGGLDPLPAGVAGSEQVLPVVIAAAGPPAQAQARYREAVALRQGGGSWGVVAHRLDTSAAQVLTALTVFERGAATGQVGTVPAALAFLSAAAGSASGGATGGPAPSPGSGSGSPGTRPGHSPAPSPSPSSSPGLLSGTLDKVLSLLPTPIPTPSPSQSQGLVPPVQLPIPVPSLPIVGGLIGSTPAPLLTH